MKLQNWVRVKLLQCWQNFRYSIQACCQGLCDESWLLVFSKHSGFAELPSSNHSLSPQPWCYPMPLQPKSVTQGYDLWHIAELCLVLLEPTLFRSISMPCYRVCLSSAMPYISFDCSALLAWCFSYKPQVRVLPNLDSQPNDTRPPPWPSLTMLPPERL